jgi:tetratricopeptide (TPR) repeat protein
MRYKETNKTPAEIAAELNVQVLIEGSVRREGNQVVVNVRIIDPSDGHALGTFTADRPLESFEGMKGEIIQSIARQLRVTMPPKDLERIQQTRKVDPEVIENHLRGMSHWFKHKATDIDQAEKYFEAALKKDPQYAPAYGGLMWVWTYRGSAQVSGKDVIAGMEKISKRMRDAGVGFDETEAEAFEAKANGEFYYGWKDWVAAGKDYEKALQMKPNSVDLRLFYWDYLAAMNKMPEARAVIERALELDPYNPFAHGSYGIYFILDRKWDDAIAQFRKMLKENMDFELAHPGLATAYHHQGKTAEAFAETKAMIEAIPGGPEIAQLLDKTYREESYESAMHLLGDLLSLAATEDYFPPTNIAKYYVYGKDKDKAFEYLEKAFEDQDSGLVHLLVDPDWDTLRTDPRFETLVKKMGFPK